MSHDQRQTRLNRIEKRGSEAIRRAFAEKKISARRADILLHLSPVESDRELAVILEAQARIRSRSQIAARVIREHLGRGRRDLRVLETDLRAALSTEQTVF